MRSIIRICAAVVMACAIPASAMASQTLSGVLPPGTTSRILHFRTPRFVQPMQFRFFAPPVNARVNYALNFCVGPRFNACGLPRSIVVVVPRGQTRLRTFSSALFAHNVLTVGQGTRVPVPYRVTITP